MNYFDMWNEQKKNIHAGTTDCHPRVGEIWWVCVGVNIGAEIYGKGEFYLRPVLVINSEDHKTFIGIPLSSKIKSSKYSCIIQTLDNRLHSVLANQIKTFDRKRLWRLKYTLNRLDYQKVNKVFSCLFKPL